MIFDSLSNSIGFLLNGFYVIGLRNLTGYDISNWAIENNINIEVKCTDNIDVIKMFYDYAFVMLIGLSALITYLILT